MDLVKLFFRNDDHQLVAWRIDDEILSFSEGRARCADPGVGGACAGDPGADWGVAYFLARPSRGVGESVTDVITAMFSCLADEKACGLGETGMAKGARCLAEPLACPGQIFSCVVYRSCRGDEPWMVVGLMPWVAGLLLPVLYIFFISAKGGGVPQALPRTSKPWWKIAGNMIFEWLDEAVSIFQGVRDAWKLHHLKFVKRPQKFISVRVNTPPGTRIAYRVRVKKWVSISRARDIR